MQKTAADTEMLFSKAGVLFFEIYYYHEGYELNRKMIDVYGERKRWGRDPESGKYVVVERSIYEVRKC